jgi:hypothetical protein
MSAAKYKICAAIGSLSEFLKCVEEEKDSAVSAGNDANFIFRGQRQDRPLLPKLARAIWNGDVLETEQLILNEFRRTSPKFRSHFADDDWDRMALAQHHGLPTRLLDWTYSAIAALWFAVKDGPAKEGEIEVDGELWMMKAALEDYINFPTKPEDTPFKGTYTRIFRPQHIADRIRAQSGLFTVHAEINTQAGPKRFIPLENSSRFSEKLVKFPIPADKFTTLRKQLDFCGVNNATMFPDLDGLCRHLEWRFTKIS